MQFITHTHTHKKKSKIKISISFPKSLSYQITKEKDYSQGVSELKQANKTREKKKKVNKIWKQEREKKVKGLKREMLVIKQEKKRLTNRDHVQEVPN